MLYDENRFLIRGQQGDGAGFVKIEERGLVVTLPTSKGSQTIVVPCEDMRTACDALERWAAFGDLQPGQPVFRPIDKGVISADRLTIAASRAS